MSVTKITYRSDTAAGDDANIGYTAAEGLILTGQGSTNDVTIKNDADADVIKIATGGTAVDVVGALTAGTVTSDAGVAGTTGTFSSDVTGLTVNATGDTSAGDNAAIGYTAGEGLILTGQGSTDDITIKNDADTTVLNVATGATDVEVSAGNILFGTANKGVYLGVTSATAANLLDDYEEGTFQPAITCSTSGTFGANSANDTLSYTKIGRHVFVVGQLNIDSESSPNGSLRIGIPFTSENSVEGANSGKTWFQMNNHGDGGIENPALISLHNVAYVQMQNIRDDGISEGIDQDRVDGNFSISLAIHYLAA